MNLLKVLKTTNSDIIIADSEADPDTRELVMQSIPDACYIPFKENAGYAKLVNAGLRIAEGEYLLIINADVLITPHDIVRMKEFLASHKQAGAVGVTGAFRFPTLNSVLARRSIWAKTPWGKRALREYEMHHPGNSNPRIVDWVRGDCWMMRKQAMRRIGFIDERFFMYLEDTDWCRRAQKEGFDIYFLPGIAITQQQRGASRTSGLKGLHYRLWHGISFIKYMLKWKNL